MAYSQDLPDRVTDAVVVGGGAAAATLRGAGDMANPARPRRRSRAMRRRARPVCGTRSPNPLGIALAEIPALVCLF
jgi:hypothetical protein